MGRILFVGGLVCMALGLVALPAVAEDDEGLRREVEKLRQEVQVMRTSMLEKDIDCGVEYISATADPSKIGEHNPYGETPTLVDRDVALYNMWVIIDNSNTDHMKTLGHSLN